MLSSKPLLSQTPCGRISEKQNKLMIMESHKKREFILHLSVVGRLMLPREF